MRGANAARTSQKANPVISASTQGASLLVRKVRGMGRGVFAGRAFSEGEVIEVCPVLILPGVKDEAELNGDLRHYVFKWNKTETELAIALGYGSLYNHSPKPNAAFSPRHSKDEMVFRAIRDIAEGEQILINYSWEETDYNSFR